MRGHAPHFRASGLGDLSSWKWLSMLNIDPSTLVELEVLKRALAEAQSTHHVSCLAGIHRATARLPQTPSRAPQSGSGQAETPEVTTSGAPSITNDYGSSTWSKTA